MLTQFPNRLRSVLSSWRRRVSAVPVKRAPALVASLGVTAFVLGLRQLGALEPMELWAYDQMLRSRPKEAPDPRLLIVAVEEKDIQQLRQWPLSDRTLATAIDRLQQYNPRVIGLDIHREFPIEPGHAQLAAQLGKSDRIITVCKAPDAETPAVASLPTVPVERIGFNDVVVDPDGVVRRALLFMRTDSEKCQTPFSFSFQLASRYLAQQGIEPQNRKSDNQLQIGSAVFPRLQANSGGYQGIDARGYQMLLNYRSADAVARTVTITQVLNNQLSPEWVRDRIVLIGTTAPSAKDTFYTPYSAIQQRQRKMPGVVVHAQMVSQILSTVLDNRPLLWYLPWWTEGLWIWGWSLLGGLGALQLRHPLRLGLAGGASLSLLGGISYQVLLQAGWIPLIPPALALVLTGGSVVVYIAYQMQQQQQQIQQLAQDQDATIALLTTMLKQNTDGTELLQREDNASTVLLALMQQSAVRSPTTDTILDGRYKMMSVLGQGGFGQTYLAQDTKRPGNPTCVVKHLKPARRDIKFLQVSRRLFENEAKILEVLGRHDQIPQLLAYFEDKEEFYLIQEYVEGHPLNEELPVDKRLSETQVVDMLIGVLEILAFVHDHKVIHRDIKPGNIIRRKRDERLVLIDFGAVKQMRSLVPEETDYQTVAIGTRGYAPPEQFAGHPRPNSDIYALGMIGIQALTGIMPQQLHLDPESGTMIWQEPESGTTILWRALAKASDEVAEIVDKMVCPHFSDRYQSAAEVLAALHRLDRSKLSTQTSATNPVVPSREKYSVPLSENLDSTVQVNQPTQMWVKSDTSHH